MLFNRKVLVLLVIGMMGCANVSNEQSGMLIGATAGGLLGNTVGSGGGQVAATAIGILAGAYIGGKIGASMDQADRNQVAIALENNKTGVSRRWRNPDNGTNYIVTPTKTYVQNNGSATQPCREFTTVAKIGGNDEKIYGTACRMDDGSWKIMSD